MNGFNAIDGLNNLTVFILNAIAVIGIAACAWGALQFALALKSQQPEQRTHAMLYIAGGLVMVGVRVMLQTLGVSRDDEIFKPIKDFNDFPKDAKWRLKIRKQLLK